MSNKHFELTSNFKIKELPEEEDSLIIEGYANTVNKDRAGDIIKSEAWTKGGLDNYLKNPIILAYHNHSNPIGTMLSYSHDERGFKVTAQISKAAGNVYQLIKDGILRTFSVGFRVKDADYEEDSDTFLIKDLELYEISVVSIPANADSTFSIRKSFESDEEYSNFKGEFIKMPNENTEALEAKIKELQAKLDDQSGTSEAVLDLVTEQLKGIQEKLEAKEKAEKEAKEKAEAEAKITAEKAGVEKLVEEVERRFSEKEKSLEEALDGLRSELKDKAAEVEALQRSKMEFADKSGISVSQKEVDDAILVSKVLGRSLSDTVVGKQLIEKSGAEHLANMGTPGDWEKEFSTRITDEMKDKLVLEPLFTTIQMNTPTLELPINPEAGDATWVTTAQMNTTDSTGTSARVTGMAHTGLYNRTLTAHKLASKEYIGYEEEEDAILPIVSIIREAVVRRMARSSDIALLRGDLNVDSGDGSVWPFNGIATIATDGSNVGATPSVGGGDKITVADCAAARRTMGKWGLQPGEVTYIVSTDAYYDLLDDPDFRTMDVVGSQATILRGQVGAVNGSPVVVSDSFASKASGATAVVAVNPRNFVVGNLRSMMVERDRDIEWQRNIIVATRRFGFLQMTTGDTEGVGVVNWAA